MVQQKTLRVKFEKTGKLKFISHLDFIRTMQNALRRAKVKVIYSEGFNPHVKASFGLPLSVGTESLCEFMDVRVEGDTDPLKTAEDLSVNLPRDMRVLGVYEPESRLTDIKYAGYTISLDFGDLSEMAAETGETIFNGPLVVMKRTKKGDRETDIKPLIKSADTAFEDGRVVIKCVLCSDSENYLNPGYIIGAFEKAVGREADHRRILRTDVYFADGKEFA